MEQIDQLKRALQEAIAIQGAQARLRNEIIEAHEKVCNEPDCSAAGHYRRTADYAILRRLIEDAQDTFARHTDECHFRCSAESVCDCGYEEWWTAVNKVFGRV